MIWIISWNIDGRLCNIERKHVIRNWLSTLKSKPHILHLQEIKVEGFKLAIALELIIPGYTQTIAPLIESHIGTMILSHPDLIIESSSTLNKNQVAWACFNHNSCIFGVVSIYAPDKPRERAKLWDYIVEFLPMGNWIFIGNFNMVLDPTDSSRPSPLIKGLS